MNTKRIIIRTGDVTLRIVRRSGLRGPGRRRSPLDAGQCWRCGPAIGQKDGPWWRRLLPRLRSSRRPRRSSRPRLLNSRRLRRSSRPRRQKPKRRPRSSRRRRRILPVGTTVSALPSGCTTLNIGGVDSDCRLRWDVTTVRLSSRTTWSMSSLSRMRRAGDRQPMPACPTGGSVNVTIESFQVGRYA